MARFILEYDVCLETETKCFILENCDASMVSPNGDSSQFCLIDVLNLETINEIDSEDLEHLNSLLTEGVNYIEIC